MRKKIKAPLTEKAMQLAFNRLKKLSTDEKIQIEIVNESVLKNWKSFYELKQENIKKTNYKNYDQRDVKDFDNLYAN